MKNVYEAYIVESRSYERSKDDKPIWTHRLVAAGVFTNQEEIKKWARKHKVSARVYVYKNGSNVLFDDYASDWGTIHHRGFAFGVFKNKRPTMISRR